MFFGHVDHDIDEEISSDSVNYVNEQGILVGIKSLRSILSSLDRSQYCIVEVNKSAIPPVCKLIKKKEFYEAQRRSSKVKSKSSHLPQNIHKELKLGWRISENDLSHKINKAIEFLSKGYNLNIIISNNKNTHKEVVDKSVMDKILINLKDYIKSSKPPEWNGGCVVLKMQGNGPSANKSKEEEKAMKVVVDDENTNDEKNKGDKGNKKD
ncbi:19910_t:CDS:2 [Entrophospora sp. SA101]|nr:13187_t:CDS:2 [Entrophospora sp. SA101]CAJ0627168.1 15456_t:CDS:2 [Entrophospora sp. SA101]CAJ0627177.1 15463_t:CDS:2 [Entrophospora sp. SA101]CAJ0744962.1 2124_t:CDS:2 [Entrophospora sp. SA101]CAJ0767951.1 19910_t:CDS:2 [Entrophospora sp. SA101]